MDKMNGAGIKVILDVAVRPAPLWLHHKYPSIDVVDANGNRQYPNHRYMDDVGDPHYQQEALRFADALARHYAKHPALLAFGLDNESGDGPISYSATVKARFIAWLKAKYGNVENLNKAWAGQRWSRRIGDFDEVGLPLSGGGVTGSPERVLDFRRFISDEVNGFLFKLIDHVNAGAPGVLTTGNFWYYSNKNISITRRLPTREKFRAVAADFIPATRCGIIGGIRASAVWNGAHPIREHHAVLVHGVHHDDRDARVHPQVSLCVAHAGQPVGLRLDVAEHARRRGTVPGRHG